MPAATNILKTASASDAGPAAQATPGGEIFAALLSGTEAATAEGATGEEPVATEATGEAQPNLDILAPLLAQQQVVPTVTVPKPGGEAVAGEGVANPDVASVLGNTPVSPLVPSEVEGRLNGASSPNAAGTAPVTTDALDQILADAPRLRSGRAAGEQLPQIAETTAAEGGEVKAALTEVAKALGKTDAPATPAATSATISAGTPTPAGDQQAGSGRQQAETPVATADVQTQQPTSSVTDVRSLIASLTSTGLAGAGGPAQAGAAQQLGQALAAQVLDLAGGSEWLDQLSQEIGRAADGSGPLRFRLTPESLGELKVEISQSDRGAIVRMTVATEAAQAALADAQPRLAAEARAQGVRIAETQVDLSGNQAQQNQQDRESARQQAAAGDPSLRAFRSTSSASSGTQTGAAASRPAERYA
ncbi:flagellar hook-length control protein FliK [Sphingosinicella sp. YJ22]|uniref:flagellar hook-length control protein FliK n=1 Tax=Sphingosinicella sp. YJ22 TaxID=1104780 RepID=UPI001FAE9C1F|nr:flagellar hook-length control protein FliK [Sphingosinicella sp. YJ22]